MKRIKSFQNKSICYLIATPIGNLGDITIRAQEILNTCDFIACEDTRTTSNLLHKFNINRPLISYHEHNEQECSQKLIKYLKEGKNIAIVSDAGYPGISDPGAIMVKHCIEEDIPVSIIPGANAFLPALIASGLDTSHFYFHGFLPSKPSERKKTLQTLKEIPVPLIFYESPHRIIDSLKDIYDTFENRYISIARELTKLNEEFIRGYLKDVISIDESTLKGEMVLVVEGKKETKPEYDNEELIKLINDKLNEGYSLKEACKIIAEETNLKKNQLYQLMIENK